MTYNKPHNLSYTDIAIWIDEHSYDTDIDDAKLYEYIYHLLVMLSHKHGYFNRIHYYDEFALSTASKIFIRIRDLKLPPIKSILNYIKAVIYPYKVEFEREFYIESPEDNNFLYADNFSLSTELVEEIDLFDKIEFESAILNSPNIIKSFLAQIPYKKESYEWNNIYMSCVLTLLDEFNLRLSEISDIENINLSEVAALYKAVRASNPILFHLDTAYAPYIKILVNQIKHLLAKEFTLDTDTYVSAETMLKSVLVAAFADED